MAADVSSLSDVLAGSHWRNALAAFAHVIIGRRQRIVLANNTTRGSRTAAECFKSHARLDACVFGDVALRRLDLGAAFDRCDGSDLECEDDSDCESFARLSKTDRGCLDLQFVYRRGVVDGLLIQLLNDARHLFHRGDCARVGRGAVSFANDLIWSVLGS